MDARVWGPHYWFFLHTLPYCYPEENPNKFIKKKFYTFYYNLPIFIPNGDIANKLSRLLNQYPVSCYLGSRKMLLKWTNFIHNKVNEELGKPIISLQDGINAYNKLYEKPVKIKNKINPIYIIGASIGCITLYLYNI